MHALQKDGTGIPRHTVPDNQSTVRDHQGQAIRACRVFGRYLLKKLLDFAKAGQGLPGWRFRDKKCQKDNAHAQQKSVSRYELYPLEVRGIHIFQTRTVCHKTSKSKYRASKTHGTYNKSQQELDTQEGTGGRRGTTNGRKAECFSTEPGDILSTWRTTVNNTC